MEDELAATDRIVDTFIALDIALDQLDVVGDGGEVLAAAGGEVVEHPHGVTVAEQAANEVGADEPGTTGDQRGRLPRTHRRRVSSPALMCGIAGKVSLSGPVDRGPVEAICAAQVHRGPDSRGIHASDGVALGIQRLRVIDLETGDQPIYNEDRSVVVVLNGEIYNYRELRAELESRGHVFSTAGDTEPIVHLYEELGDACVERLDGMFAFALWDSRRRRLLIARDRVGKKPLHYHHAADGSLTFASELAALLSDRSIPRSLDPSSLDCYLAYGYVQAPETIYRDVCKLPPAHTLVWEEGRISTKRYWRLDYERKLEGELPDLEGELRSLVAAAVRKRMIADVPLGAFLSGGVDSSIVVSEMAHLSPSPVRTFSIGFDHDDYNELPQARLVSERFGTEHTEFTVTPDAIELLPKLVRHYGEPYSDSSAIPSFYLAEITRRHVTVALNGDGGDESFAGYLRTAADARTAWLDRLPSAARARVGRFAVRGLERAGRFSGAAYGRRFLKTLGDDAVSRYATHVGVFGSAERAALLADDVLAEIDPARSAEVIAGPWRRSAGLDPLDRLLAVDLDSYLPADLLTKVDIATMAHSLEARSPLLDPALMQFAASLPPRMKLRGLQKKWLLRRAYRWSVPEEILNGPKRGFGVPLGAWFRGDLRAQVEEVLRDPGVGGGLLRPESVRALLDEHMSERADHSHQIWSLLFLEAWRDVA